MRELCRPMTAIFRCLSMMVSLLCLSPLVFPQDPASRIREADRRQKRLDVHINHLVDLVYVVCKYAASKSRLPDVEGFEAVVNGARRLQTDFEGWVGPGLAILNSVLITCRSASEVVEKFSQLPESITTRKGTQVRIRDAAIRYAKAIEAFEPAFLKNVWPRHKQVVERAAAYIAKEFEPKEQECFDYLTSRLGMEDSQSQVPIYLVAESPWPGGFTFWGETRKGTCVSSIESYQGSALFETLLHEAIHALDMETKGKGNVLADIENRLLKAGLGESDLALRHGPHLLVFIQSAETVRRLIDPSHRAYGEREQGVYARLKSLSDIELPAWTAHLDGKISREDAVDRISEGLVKVSKETKSTKSQ